jgi:type VI secretion system VasD/TssJ family lipoprotein
VAGGLALAAVLGATGCATTDRITLTSSPRLNTCEGGGDPHAVVVRIYYLRATDRFTRADFAALWQDDAAALADDRIALEERTVNPRQQLAISLERKDAAKAATAIGVVANFCRPGEGCWRRTVPISGGAVKLRVHLDEGCLSID